MGYFGGLGAGKGWHKYHFLIDTDELRELLSLERISLVKTNGRVPADYVDTSICEYIESYTSYLQHLRTDAAIGWTITQPLYISLTTNCGMISSDLCPDTRYKLLRPSEPVIGWAPLTILSADDKVFVNIMGKNQGYFGLSMTFPKVVSFGSEGHQILHPTQTYANAALYERLQTYLAETTSPCTIASRSRVQRTSMRISKSCKSWVNEHAYLRLHELAVR